MELPLAPSAPLMLPLETHEPLSLTKYCHVVKLIYESPSTPCASSGFTVPVMIVLPFVPFVPLVTVKLKDEPLENVMVYVSTLPVVSVNEMPVIETPSWPLVPLVPSAPLKAPLDSQPVLPLTYKVQVATSIYESPSVPKESLGAPLPVNNDLPFSPLVPLVTANVVV